MKTKSFKLFLNFKEAIFFQSNFILGKLLFRVILTGRIHKRINNRVSGKD